MTRRSRSRRLLTLLAAAGALAVVVLSGVYWRDIAAWIRFYSLFESIGLNDQGYPEYRHRQTGIVMVRVPGGTFLMGRPREEVAYQFSELPRHEVRVSPFFLAKYEVTQAQWKRVMGEKPSHFSGDDLPMESISWNDCFAFCELTGLGFPSEAQWEYACRAGTETRYAFGEIVDADQVNYRADLDSPPGEWRRRTVPVENFAPNDFGLLNMHGNVWEYCLDVFDEKFYSKPAALRMDPVSESGSDKRVIRGGSWGYGPKWMRSAARDFQAPDFRRQDLGFRPAFHPLPPGL